ncbi:unnamed protein product [Rangifer tarandus platyrhynchus]|uniref:Uncharacterized protein n=1 Tax=Rangifer tarandus platyrhynchus TaxID=3082113 RepID=A0AC59YXH8_RANTA
MRPSPCSRLDSSLAVLQAETRFYPRGEGGGEASLDYLKDESVLLASSMSLVLSDDMTACPVVRADALSLQEFLFTRCPAPSHVTPRLLTSSSPTHVHTFGSGLSLHFENISVSEAEM